MPQTSFVKAMKEFFGLLPGQTVLQFGAVMNDSYNACPATLRIPDPFRRLALFSDN